MGVAPAIRRALLPLAVAISLAADGGSRARTSTASLGPGREQTSPTIRVAAGPVRVVHAFMGLARHGGTRLEGLDEQNRSVEYNWTGNGTYQVDVPGRYRHRALGAMVGNQRGTRIISRLTYEELPDTTR
ncbi:MAG TPA: hypothetical protein VF970_01440 [Gemmatimonadales bacterium]